MSRNKSIKNKEEVRQYKKSVKSLMGYSNTTDGDHFPSLQGSNEDYYANSSSSQEDVKGLARARIKVFLKKHIFEEIISVALAIALAVAGWTVSSVITLREKIAAYDVRIEVAQSSLTEIKDDYASKEFLSNELEILELKLKNAQKDELSSIETQIALIENEIKYILARSK